MTLWGNTVNQHLLEGDADDQGRHHNHHHNDNQKSIKVDQQVNQQNQCFGQLLARMDGAVMREVPSTLCINEGNNSANIGR